VSTLLVQEVRKGWIPAYLLSVHDVHNHTAFQHACQAFLGSLRRLALALAILGGTVAISDGEFSRHCLGFVKVTVDGNGL